jgi:hypothetical protein
MDARAFFTEVSRLIDDNPPDPAGRAVLERLHDMGACGSPLPGLEDELARGLWAGRASVRAETRRSSDGGAGSWRVASELGSEGDALQRACVARSGVADPAVDVFHAQVDRDADDCPLNGRCRYVLRFAPDAPPPVHGFWSLETLPVRAHAVGDRRGLTLDPDGSLPVHIQRRPPARRRRSNWLQAPADGFSVALHLYWPRDEALQRRWSPPPVTRVD